VIARRLALVLGLVMLLAPAARPQGLGDVAARERESREKGAKRPDMAPVFTNDDLEAYSPPGGEDEASEEAPDVDEAGSSSGSSSTSREEPEREPSGRQAELSARREAVNRAQAEVDSIERRIRELNGRLNPMSRDYVYGAASSGDAAGEELRIKNELAELQERLIEARQDLARANQARSGSPERREPTPSDMY
jgi:hypothetical protein